MNQAPILLSVILLVPLGGLHAANPLALGGSANPAPLPADGIGFPSRDADLDALPGFRNPPPGYGQVPFW